MDFFEAGKFFGGILGWSVDTSVNVAKATAENTVLTVQGVIAGYNATNRNAVKEVEAPAIISDLSDFVPTVEQAEELEALLAKMAATNSK